MEKSVAGIVDVFEAIRKIVEHTANESTQNNKVVNAADREIFIKDRA